MIVSAITMSPPAPSPWMARKAISWLIDWARPESTEPIRNTTMANWKTMRRP